MQKYHLPEVFCTAWMDNGAETPVDAVLPGLVLFAHLGFHEDFDEKALAEEFHDVTGAGLNDFLELDALDSLFQNGQPNLDTDNPSNICCIRILFSASLTAISKTWIWTPNVIIRIWQTAWKSAENIPRLMIRCLLSITVSPARSPVRPTLASA